MSLGSSAQLNFGGGLLDYRLKYQFNDPTYSSCLLEAKNILITPYGGIKNRGGTKFIYDLTDKGPVFQLINFEYSVDVQYLLIFYPTGIMIFKKTPESVIFETEIVSPFNLHNRIKYAQSSQNMVLTDGNVHPKLLTLNLPGLSWTLADVPFTAYPTHSFVNIPISTKFTFNMAHGLVTVTSTTPIFSAAQVNGIFYSPICLAYISEYDSATQIKVITLNAQFFATDDNTAAGTALPSYGADVVIKERVWSTARGWPNNPCIYNGRLWFGGCTALPGTIFGSVVGDQFNFRDWEGLAGDALNYTVDAHQLNTITHLVAARDLIALTNNGVYIGALSEDGQSVKVTPQSQNGCDETPPLYSDNQIFYIQRGGYIIRNILYDYQIEGYKNEDISKHIPGHVIDPSDSAMLRYNDDFNTNYGFFVNSDGSVLIYQSDLDKSIMAFTESDTGMRDNDDNTAKIFDKFIGCEESADSIFFIVNRNIDGDEKYYLELMDQKFDQDCYVLKSNPLSMQTITGLEYLEGRTVYVIRDGIYETDKVVTGGEITADEAGFNFHIGLRVPVRVQPLPPLLKEKAVSLIFRQKQLFQFYLAIVDSANIRVDGVLKSALILNQYLLGSIAKGITDIVQFKLSKKWEKDETVLITYDDAAPMTINGIGYDFDVTPLS